MARSPRLRFPGGIFHVMARAIDGMTLFKAPEDFDEFLELLGGYSRTFEFTIHAFCLMPNHLHLLIAAGRIPLERLMHRALGKFAMLFNWRNDRVGHVFQDRYKAILCHDDPYYLQLHKYLDLNPVEAGLVERPADWKWSSHRVYAEGIVSPWVDPELTLRLLHPDPEKARRAYRRMFDDSVGYDINPSPKPPPAAPRIVRSAAANTPPGLDALCAQVASEVGLGAEAMRGPSRQRHISAARQLFMRKALAAGHRPTDIAAFVGRTVAAVCQAASSNNLNN